MGAPHSPPPESADHDMVSFYDEVEIEDFAWDDGKQVFHFPCPCGDRFEITKGQLGRGDDVAVCPSCSLLVRVIFDMMDFEEFAEEDLEEAEQQQDQPQSISVH